MDHIDPITLGILVNVLTGYVVNLTTPQLQREILSAIELKPALTEKARALARDPSQSAAEDFLRDVRGVISATAGTGTIEIDRATLRAPQSIGIDHERGAVSISSSRLSTPVLQLGGSVQNAGATAITASSLRSDAGAETKVEPGGVLRLTGTARFRQT